MRSRERSDNKDERWWQCQSELVLTQRGGMSKRKKEMPHRLIGERVDERERKASDASGSKW